MFNLPENFKIINGTSIVTTSGAVVGDYISLKNAISCTIVAKFLQAATHATILGINEATDVAGTGAAAVTAHQKLWKCAAVLVSDELVAVTDSETVACTAGTTNQVLVIQFDPRTLTAGFDCIAATTTASSEATNFVDITYYIETKYPQATPPAAITD